MVLLVALLVPMLMALGSIVIGIGNWYVHARHLQTQVDAAAFAAGTQFTGCFVDPIATNTAIRVRALEYAGDANRDPTTTNLQVQEPADVHVVLNSERYWQVSDAVDDTTLSTMLDNSITYPGDPFPPPADPSDPCETRFLDVKATDADVPVLWRWLPLFPDVKRKARIEIRKVLALSPTLPFAVPEIDPGAVAVIVVDEDATVGDEVVSAVELSPSPPPTGSPLTKFNVYDGLVGGVEISSRDNLSVIVLVSRTDVPDPELGGTSLAAICGQFGVRCYAGGGQQNGLALVHGYSTGSGTPRLGRVTLTGCNDAVNLGGPYFVTTGDCAIAVSAEIDFGSLVNPQVRLHGGSTCSGSSTAMTQSGAIWEAATSLPEPDQFTGPVSFSIAWKAGAGGFTCFPGGTVARPYVKNGKAGPVDYLALQAYDAGGNLMPNAYSIPKEPTMQPFTFMVTVGLQPPLAQSTLNDQAVLLRFASEDDPSLTQSIDCDVDSYSYPPPYDTMPKDAAEIAHGCVTPYAANPTLDCSGYGFGDLPPDPAPEVEEATDCAISKQGQVSSLRKGLSARFESPCTDNMWPDPPITTDKIENLVDTLETDPRLVTLIVTEYAAFAGTGSTIVPIKYFAGFYVTGWDVSNETPGCYGSNGEVGAPYNDPHPIFGSAYLSQTNKWKLDDGDVWGYFVTPVIPLGSPSGELCAFDELGTCVAVLVE